MKFITLGPAGSNHEFVANRYLDFHGLRLRGTVEVAGDFQQCAAAVLTGQADFLIQCAVHPATMQTMAKYFNGLFAIDTFISGSQDLSIMQRRDVERPDSLAVMRPTLDYIDGTQWDRIEWVETVAEVTQGLIEGIYAAGLGYTSAAQSHPELLRETQFIGTVDDVWIVYGRTRVSAGQLLAWRGAPAGLLYRQTQ